MKMAPALSGASTLAEGLAGALLFPGWRVGALLL
jgi:hypothetical protein